MTQQVNLELWGRIVFWMGRNVRVEYAQFLGALHLVIGVTTPAARRTRLCARDGLLINRRFAVHAASDVPNRNFLKINDCSLVRVRVKG